MASGGKVLLFAGNFFLETSWTSHLVVVVDFMKLTAKHRHVFHDMMFESYTTRIRNGNFRTAT